RLTGVGSGGGSTISASRRSSANMRPGLMPDRARIVRNFGRLMTSVISASKAGLLTKVSIPARTPSISSCGAPCQNRPDSSTLVSMTARTLAAPGSYGLHFRIYLFHRHRFDAGSGDAIGDRQKVVGGLPASDGVGDQTCEGARRQQTRIARGLCRCV